MSVRAACEAADRRIESGDEYTIDSLRCQLDGATASFMTRDPLAAACRLSKTDALAVFETMAAEILAIVEAEKGALRTLQAVK